MRKGDLIWIGFVLFFVGLSFALADLGDSGTISINILPSDFQIWIHSPEDGGVSSFGSVEDLFSVDLNVSASAEANVWDFSLFELERTRAGGVVLGGNQIYDSQAFLPNTTFEAARWENRIYVHAEDIYGREDDELSEFYVHVPNSAPSFVLGTVPSVTYVCEGTEENPGFLSFDFGATDVDETDLFFGLQPTQGYGLFYVERSDQTISSGLTSASGEFYSSNLVGQSGVYSLSVLVGENSAEPPLSETGEEGLAGISLALIDVIEMNALPYFENPLGVQTLWSFGENSSLYHDFNATDEEDGSEDDASFVYGVSFDPDVELFEIGPDGMIEFDAEEKDLGIYLVSVCVTDLPLEDPHPLIQSYCDQDGSANTVCNVFELTITDENRPPRFESWWPEDLEFEAVGQTELYFNVTEFDPDLTIPDAYWYVDGVFMEYDNLSLFDEFSYSFPCGVSGDHQIWVEITDGELNDTLVWNVSVQGVACPSPPASSGGGGGGGGGMPTCTPKWGCDNWRQCKFVETGLVSGDLVGEDYRMILDDCSSNGWNGDFCGYQIRVCDDLNVCNREIGRPFELQACNYVENPTCSDGVKNCHDGDCEFLVDCGGPCPACPTCSDGIRNQGEQGVDCGGPCPTDCPEQLLKMPSYWIFLWIGLGILIVVVGVWAYRIWKRKKAVGIVLRSKIH